MQPLDQEASKEGNHSPSPNGALERLHKQHQAVKNSINNIQSPPQTDKADKRLSQPYLSVKEAFRHKAS